jgi:hypothetical protein
MSISNKLCRDCKFIKRGDSEYSHPVCRISVIQDFVDGHDEFRTCRNERSYGECGHEAKFFEPAPLRA